MDRLCRSARRFYRVYQHYERKEEYFSYDLKREKFQKETASFLPSERAYAYKMKMDAIRHQGQRTDLTSPQVAAKFRADDEVGKDAGVSGDTVRRYVRLTNLIPEVLDMVDEKKIAFNPAVELSYLKPQEQKDFIEAMDYLYKAGKAI